MNLTPKTTDEYIARRLVTLEDENTHLKAKLDITERECKVFESEAFKKANVFTEFLGVIGAYAYIGYDGVTRIQIDRPYAGFDAHECEIINEMVDCGIIKPTKTSEEIDRERLGADYDKVVKKDE